MIVKIIKKNFFYEFSRFALLDKKTYVREGERNSIITHERKELEE